jgi:hypothetical protein
VRRPLPVLLASLLLLPAPAEAAFVRGTNRADLLRGTAARDLIHARGGNDRVHAWDGAVDRVRCGGGRDILVADRRDRIGADCELVSRGLSRDPYRNPEGQHETQVEPDSFSFGRRIVTTFQSGRNFGGGASNIGFATSPNGGASWRAGFLPAVTRLSQPAGSALAASDPVVAYDAVHRTWLIASLPIFRTSTSIVVSRSSNGLSWSRPITLVGQPLVEGDTALDKEWIACDNWALSPFRGSCYVSYSDYGSNRLLTQTSRDGGLTWSAGVGPRLPGVFFGTQPVSRPNGDLVVPYVAVGGGTVSVRYVRSTDGGRTFSGPVDIAASVQPGPNLGVRSFVLPSVDVDAAGTLYLAWTGCVVTPSCPASDLLLARSTDGVTWAAPARVPAGQGANPAVVGLAVAPGTSGARARLALVYYELRSPRGIHAAAVQSTDGGTSWTLPQRLNALPMSSRWLPATSSGRMLGDYISASYVGGRAVAVFALAGPPQAGVFREAIFAARLPAVRR